MIKTYKLFKTTKKTARENNLVPVQYGTNVLVDISILENIPLEQEHKNAIIDNIQKLHVYHDKAPVFIVLYDDYTTFEVRASCVNHRIFNNTGKYLYTINQFTNIKITRVKYLDFWKDKKEVAEYIAKTCYQEPITDIEI